MTPWWRGFLTGAAAALAVTALLTGGTRFDAFVRVAGGGYQFDARLDEPVVGRVVNVPVGVLGEAVFRKRDWVLVTTYEFTLRVRPEVTSAAGRAVQDLQVTVRLPGFVRATNADRAGGGAVVWDRLPPRPPFAHTIAVHWLQILVMAGAGAAAFAAGRRS